MKPKSRGNGQGSAYRRGRTWTAQVVVGWKASADGKKAIPVKRTKGGFPTKAAAISYCPQLASASDRRARLTLQDVYDAWEPFYTPRVGSTTMSCYRAAYKHFSQLHHIYIDAITAVDLQACMDACTAGKRTHQMMKVTAGLLWAYAVDRGAVEKDITKNLFIGRHQSVKREPLTDRDIDLIRNAVGTIEYADYIYCLCYLGFRPGELLRLKKSDYHEQDGLAWLVGGSKTEAGRGRRVPVPAAISSIISARLAVPGTDLIFPQTVRTRNGKFTGYKEMSDAYLRTQVFNPLCSTLGISPGKTPYSARHSYSDKLKHADGDDKTKAALMGHTDYAFTQSAYQSITPDDLKKVADSIK